MNSALKASNCLLAAVCARCAAGLNYLHISKRSKAEVAEFAKIAVTLANGWRAGPILTKWEGSGAVKWLRVIYLLRWDKPFDGMDNQDTLISFDRQIWRILLTRLYLKPNNCKSSLGVWWGNIISGVLYLQCLHLFGFQNICLITLTLFCKIVLKAIFHAKELWTWTVNTPLYFWGAILFQTSYTWLPPPCQLNGPTRRKE